MKKSENKPIFVDVKFEESLSKEHCLFIMLELVKNLIYQRRQIPLTFETLKREMQKYYNSFANVRFFLILTFIKVLLLKSNYFKEQSSSSSFLLTLKGQIISECL